MADEELLRRLDRMQATLELAFKPQLDSARERVRAEPVKAAILDVTDAETWTASTAVQEEASKADGVGERAVRTALAELVDDHVLDVRGTERAREYRQTGLV